MLVSPDHRCISNSVHMKPVKPKCPVQVGVWTKSCGMEDLKQSLGQRILINHWPTAGFWQAATALSAAAAHLCAHLPAQLLLMHIHRIPHLYVHFLFECPSSPLPPLLLLLHLFPWILSSRPGLLQSWPRLKPSKGPLPLFCPPNWFCWGKKKQWRYIAHNLFMVPFDMCDI